MLKINRNRLVIFITPINNFLIQGYASPEDAEKDSARIANARQALLRYLQQRGIDSIDAAGQFDAESFVDMIHPNARGDRRIAELIAGYLQLHPSAAANEPRH